MSIRDQVPYSDLIIERRELKVENEKLRIENEKLRIENEELREKLKKTRKDKKRWKKKYLELRDGKKSIELSRIEDGLGIPPIKQPLHDEALKPIKSGIKYEVIG